MFKLQSRYIVERQDPDLWAKVLVPENKHRRQLIDQARILMHLCCCLALCHHQFLNLLMAC